MFVMNAIDFRPVPVPMSHKFTLLKLLTYVTRTADVLEETNEIEPLQIIKPTELQVSFGHI